MKTGATTTNRQSLEESVSRRGFAFERTRPICAVLVGIAILGFASTSRGAESFCADSVTMTLCNQGVPFGGAAMRVPDLFPRLVVVTPGVFDERPGSGTATWTGEVSVDGDPSVRFDVVLNFTGRVNPGDPNFPPPDSPTLLFEVWCYHPSFDTEPANWHYYTSVNGTLVGLSGSNYDGAVYSITLATGSVQVGRGANNASYEVIGLWGAVTVQAVGELPDPTLPAGPAEGFVHLELTEGCFPPPLMDVTGTWHGTVDCAGFDFDVDEESVNSELAFGSAVLKFGNQSGYRNYGAELFDGAEIHSFCADISNDPGSRHDGQGVLTSAEPSGDSVFLKVKVDRGANTGTLRARQLHITSDGAQLCKWSFTLVDLTDPQIADSCTP